MFPIEALAECWTPICFHILAEIRVLLEYLEKDRDGAKQFGVEMSRIKPFRSVVASFAACISGISGAVDDGISGISGPLLITALFCWRDYQELRESFAFQAMTATRDRGRGVMSTSASTSGGRP